MGPWFLTKLEHSSQARLNYYLTSNSNKMNDYYLLISIIINLHQHAATCAWDQKELAVMFLASISEKFLLRPLGRKFQVSSPRGWNNYQRILKPCYFLVIPKIQLDLQTHHLSKHEGTPKIIRNRYYKCILASSRKSDFLIKQFFSHSRTAKF